MRWTPSRKLEVLIRLEKEGYDAMKNFLSEHNISDQELYEWRHRDVHVYQAMNAIGVQLAI